MHAPSGTDHLARLASELIFKKKCKRPRGRQKWWALLQLKCSCAHSETCAQTARLFAVSIYTRLPTQRNNANWHDRTKKPKTVQQHERRTNKGKAVSNSCLTKAMPFRKGSTFFMQWSHCHATALLWGLKPDPSKIAVRFFSTAES